VWILFVLSLLVNLGMWGERFMIIVQSLQQEFLPSMWAAFAPTWVDLGILLGTMGFFTFLFLLFLRFLPFISLSEMRELKHQIDREERHA
jgi:molybdopterin-containing oxidoreductase family membrane subunit